jgi:RNA polymerase sigma-70 factor (ECF subfamily)
MSQRRGPHSVLPSTTAEIFHAYAPFAWRVLRRLGLSEADADDACQEVFIIAHRRLHDFQGRSSLRTWVYGICVHIVAKHRRRVRSRREIAPVPESEPVSEATQEADLALREELRELDRVLDALDEDKRAVFVLYEIEDLPMVEVAAAVGCPLQTAYSRLHAARRVVEQAMNRFQRRVGTR